ncbi:single hybrid motif-containing protein [Dendrothele bispora CBS 962.96]|uniref:Single hybrid motif-containing protein n=1 Tax=Dendrothele bispora (strain CBS 962.96) TaxID=1314807 RepID=A0A4S8MZJ6_DENBC|nr:single hybrid motif-containing protein [Dendrothele bispora CBS 962.96]
MASARALSRVAQRSLSAAQCRALHQSSTRHAVTNMQMPAMSPTMTEGGIASWKKKEGESFAAGDVLLEIETDKATIDVEAQDDGVVGKIIIPDGTKNVPVGKVIALLAEEGDDISNLEAPKEEESSAPVKQEAASSPTPPPTPPQSSSTQSSTSPQTHSYAHPTHSRPLFPSVYRLLAEHNITDTEKIKGTGVRGMLTKGDILAFLGRASGPLGTFKPSPSPIEVANKASKPAEKRTEAKSLDGPALRQLIVSAMLQDSIKARSVPAPATIDFDSVIADYLPSKPSAPSQKAPVPLPAPSKASSDFLDGLI